MINQALDNIRGLEGKRVGNGQCYGLVAYYASLLNGPRMGAGIQAAPFDGVGDTVSAHAIGNAYNWAKFGWTVSNKLRVGGIINIKAYQGQPFVTGQYGHTAIITAIDGNKITLHEQNYLGMEKVVKNVYYLNDAFYNSVASVVYPTKYDNQSASSKSSPFRVKVSISNLRLRSGAGLNAKVLRLCPTGVYTIIDTKTADGLEWGKLKSGAGWIALKYATNL